MAGVAHGSIKGSGVPVSVAKEFNQADKGTGIMTKGEKPRPAAYAAGGPVLNTSNSRFLKTEDAFRSEGAPNPSYAGGKPKGKDKVTTISKK